MTGRLSPKRAKEMAIVMAAQGMNNAQIGARLHTHPGRIAVWVR